ncbi:hypothetical protein TNCV_4512791 [Trichonephila clavipes]|nr:hypothetical protein TNCV_4512791 [Trichonephila clavipes]
MYHSLEAEVQRKIIVAGIVQSFCLVDHSTAENLASKDCQTHLRKSNVMMMSAEAMTIRTMRFSAAATYISYTSDLRRPQKKSKGLRFGELGGQTIGPSSSTPFLGSISANSFRHCYQMQLKPVLYGILSLWQLA